MFLFETPFISLGPERQILLQYTETGHDHFLLDTFCLHYMVILSSSSVGTSASSSYLFVLSSSLYENFVVSTADKIVK